MKTNNIMIEQLECVDSEEAVKNYNTILKGIIEYIERHAMVNRDVRLSLSEIERCRDGMFDVFGSKKCFNALSKAIEQLHDLYTEELEDEVERMRSNELSI